ELNGQDAAVEDYVRRAEDFNVQAVGVVPPVVEGSGSQHGGAAPGGDECARRAVKAPDFDGCRAQRRITAQGAGEDQVAAGNGGDDAAGLDGQVRGRPEGVAA